VAAASGGCKWPLVGPFLLVWVLLDWAVGLLVGGRLEAAAVVAAQRAGQTQIVLPELLLDGCWRPLVRLEGRRLGAN